LKNVLNTLRVFEKRKLRRIFACTNDKVMED
jgi:hypothetical protein